MLKQTFKVFIQSEETARSMKVSVKEAHSSRHEGSDPRPPRNDFQLAKNLTTCPV